MYFNLDIDDLGSGFSAAHAACCVACLPLGSRLLSAIDPRASWTTTDYRLYDIACMLAGKRLPFPWEQEKSSESNKETRKLDLGRMPLDEFRRWYNETKWEEAENGGVIGV